MAERDCPNGLNAEPYRGRVHVYAEYASLTMSPEAALRTADRLRLAAQEALEQATARREARAAAAGRPSPTSPTPSSSTSE